MGTERDAKFSFFFVRIYRILLDSPLLCQGNHRTVQRPGRSESSSRRFVRLGLGLETFEERSGLTESQYEGTVDFPGQKEILILVTKSLSQGT